MGGGSRWRWIKVLNPSLLFPPARDCVVFRISGRKYGKLDRQTGEKALERNLLNMRLRGFKGMKELTFLWQRH
jgi:hypothetical protein